jgi:ribosome-binding protein aMBF1 (putative translation factor)
MFVVGMIKRKDMPVGKCELCGVETRRYWMARKTMIFVCEKCRPYRVV